ncbi:MAG: hypothetical protein JWO92_1200 [Chitinophagaceae bacterium]|nr:hypothetical protein [Chitinophagaceae bacterium]
MPTDQLISLQTGIDMTTLYRQEKENILATAYKDQNILPISETFDRAAIDAIMQQEGCTAFRIYYGMSEELLVHAVLVGVNADNEDILPSTENIVSNLADPVDDIIAEQGVRCPPDCAPPSPLNG